MWRNSDSCFPQRVAWGNRCRSPNAFAALWNHWPLRTSAAPVIPVKALNLHSAGRRRLWWFQGKPLRIFKPTAGWTLGGGWAGGQDSFSQRWKSDSNERSWISLLFSSPGFRSGSRKWFPDEPVSVDVLQLSRFFSSFHPVYPPPVLESIFPSLRLAFILWLTVSFCPSQLPVESYRSLLVAEPLGFIQKLLLWGFFLCIVKKEKKKNCFGYFKIFSLTCIAQFSP